MKLSKSVVFIISLLIIIQGCQFNVNRGGKNRGELVGANKSKRKIFFGKKNSWTESSAYGMVKIPKGSYTMGMNNEDDFTAWNSSKKTITVDAFWMDETEITNNEYKQFVEWVKEYSVRQILSEKFDEYRILEDENGEQLAEPEIDWETKIDWESQEVTEAIEPLMYPSNERVSGDVDNYDVRKLTYQWEWFDYIQAAKVKYDHKTGNYIGTIIDAQGNVREVIDRSSFIMRDETNIYPNVLVWLRDFTYSYNEPMAREYFTHPGFDDYPVVGVNWKQANAFCHWRTKIKREAGNNSRKGYINKNYVAAYRLPTEAEWEWAARGGRLNVKYPWGGPYTLTKQGCFLTNFKPRRGNYASDGYTYTAPVGSFSEGRNDYGLYDMSGNVAEWTSSAYDEASVEIVHDLNPNYQYDAKSSDPRIMKRKVVRGGSWKDVKYYLQVGVRSYAYEYEATSYIGFRCVRSYIGDN